MVLVTLFGIFTLLQVGDAIINVPVNPLADAPVECIAALQTEFDCDTKIRALTREGFFPKKDLDLVCTTACRSALAARRQPVAEACGSYAYQEPNGLWYSPTTIVDERLFVFDSVCRKSRTTRDYCNSWHANFNTTDASGVVIYNPPTGADICNDCYLGDLAGDLKSPFGYSDELSSVHSSATASCKSTAAYAYVKPTSINVTPPGGAVTPTPTATTCSGKKYTVLAGDSCKSIAAANSITVAELMVSNSKALSNCNLALTAGTELCIRKKACTLYTVQAEDTCAKIVAKYSELKVSQFTKTQLASWNRNLRTDCSNLAALVGTTLCVSNPGGDYKPPVTDTQPENPQITTVAPPPGNVAANVTERCGKYYTIGDRDNCAAVMMKNSITSTDFHILNPGVNLLCTNLVIGEAYCVKPVGSIESYTNGIPTPTSMKNFFDLPAETGTISWPSAGTPVPLANGTRTDCFRYEAAEGNFTTDGALMPCYAFASANWAPYEQFLNWNPEAANQIETTGQCFIKPGVRYCTGLQKEEISDPDTSNDNAPLTAIPGDTVEGCRIYWTVMAGDSCSNIVSNFEITLATLYKWNPSVKSDCSGMQLDVSYCVLGPYEG